MKFIFNLFYLFQSNFCVKFISFLVSAKMIILRLFTKIKKKGKTTPF